MTQADAPAEITYRDIEAPDLPALHALSVQVKWPHRLEDWRTLLQIGHGIVALSGRTIVGVTAYWPHGQTHATLGLVIVSPEHQGKRIGNALMTRVLAACGQRTVLLNATPAGAGLYARLGFVPSGEVRQHQGATFTTTLHAPIRGDRIRPVTRADFSEIVALHSVASGMDRASILPVYLEQSACIALDSDGVTTGFALYRRFGRGHVIGPVVAADIDQAKMLISYWLTRHPGQFIRVDVADLPELSQWLDSLGIVCVDTVCVMTRGQALNRPASPRVFALINHALS